VFKVGFSREYPMQAAIDRVRSAMQIMPSR
jgi:hypothetical protein